MGEKFHKILNAFFLVKKRPNNKNLDIILFTYSRGAQNSLFHCGVHISKDTEVIWVLVYVTSKQ